MQYIQCYNLKINFQYAIEQNWNQYICIFIYISSIQRHNLLSLSESSVSILNVRNSYVYKRQKVSIKNKTFEKYKKFKGQ